MLLMFKFWGVHWQGRQESSLSASAKMGGPGSPRSHGFPNEVATCWAGRPLAARDQDGVVRTQFTPHTLVLCTNVRRSSKPMHRMLNSFGS